MSRDKKFALVTGCGKGGIGEALVQEYTRRGIFAVATVLPNENSDHLTAAGITWFPLDVTDDESVVSLKKEISSLTNGYLEFLVNNANTMLTVCRDVAGYTMTAIDTDIEAVRRMFEVNVFGPMRMVHHFHGMLIQAAGTIVNIGSIGGVVPYMYGASYNASKAALHHYSNTLRLEMSPFNVKVLTVISGEVGTNILKNDVHRKLPEGSYYEPLADDFRNHVQRTPKTTSRFEYASNVVSQSLRSSPAPWFWTGSATGIIRFLDMFAWRTIWDFFFYREFNLNKVREAHLAKKKNA
ncbi:NAD(P)-binding protein [Trichoderma longibrachiatum ATCC 18648]|uniref:NAD(P)-binding protein n=1 Tax=Trichoderma longibrachiatum ATCC 18648 TaxID=983965 RepID=A0A2T4C0S6_TRILO|nr:NAD(P)-binding protein [Trichoderma longibrachiatum ATCC 18648]